MTPYILHKKKWIDCTLCPLSAKRTNVCLKRGPVPCDVLMVGEAPGASEDVLGEPFVGPAGHLLDDIVARANIRCFKIGYTNLVGCIPLGEDGDKTQEPPLIATKKCSPRLVEFIKLANPRLVVWVGKCAAKHGVLDKKRKTVEIVHPAAILRADASQQPIMFQRATVTLADAFSEL